FSSVSLRCVSALAASVSAVCCVLSGFLRLSPVVSASSAALRSTPPVTLRLAPAVPTSFVPSHFTLVATAHPALPRGWMPPRFFLWLCLCPLYRLHQRPLGIHPGQVRPVLGRSKNITRGLDARGRLGGSLGQGAIIWHLAGQQRLSVSCTKRFACSASDPNPHPSTMTFGVQCDYSGNSHHGKARSRLWHFEVGTTGVS